MTTPAIPMQVGDGYTVEDWLALPDDGLRYELIDGSLIVTPAPSRRHQRIIEAIRDGFREALPPSMLIGDTGAGIATRDLPRSQALIPDLLVTRAAPMLDQDLVRPEEVILAVEVASPSSWRRDHHDKRDVFGRWGVPYYWVVDWQPAPRVMVLRLEGDRYVEIATARPPRTLKVAEPFPVHLDLGELFGDDR